MICKTHGLKKKSSEWVGWLISVILSTEKAETAMDRGQPGLPSERLVYQGYKHRPCFKNKNQIYLLVQKLPAFHSWLFTEVGLQAECQIHPKGLDFLFTDFFIQSPSPHLK